MFFLDLFSLCFVGALPVGFLTAPLHLFGLGNPVALGDVLIFSNIFGKSLGFDQFQASWVIDDFLQSFKVGINSFFFRLGAFFAFRNSFFDSTLNRLGTRQIGVFGREKLGVLGHGNDYYK